MRDFSILIPSLSPKKFDLINCIKDNDDGVNVKVFCTNCNEQDLPPADMCDGGYVVVRNDHPDYIQQLLALCTTLKIDIIIPRLTSELEILSCNVDVFNAMGVKVAVTPYDGLTIANDKSRLYSMYSNWMPRQMMAHTSDDVRMFAEQCPRFCCKLPKSSGAVGFAIVDDEKANDVTLFHAYGYKHYISTEHLCHIIDTQNLDYILQEFIPGNDYTVSLIADNGKVTHIVGYVGYEMEFSCIMYGEILPNDKAFEISEKIVSDLNLSGNIGLDFILTLEGDVVLLEVNPRMNATLPFVAKAGCNMPYLQCKHLLGYDISNDGKDIQVGLKMRKHYVADYFV